MIECLTETTICVVAKPLVMIKIEINAKPFFIVASIVSVFTVFRRTVGRIRNFFSLKPLAPKGQSSLKISAH